MWSHFEIMMVAPTNPVVLVQGICQWALSGGEWDEGGAMDVHSTCDADRWARWDGSGSFSDGDMFLPRWHTPQNVQQAVAQMAASKGREMSRDCRSASRWCRVIGGRGRRYESAGAHAIAFRLNRLVRGLSRPDQGNS